MDHDWYLNSTEGVFSKSVILIWMAFAVAALEHLVVFNNIYINPWRMTLEVIVYSCYV